MTTAAILAKTKPLARLVSYLGILSILLLSVYAASMITTLIASALPGSSAGPDTVRSSITSLMLALSLIPAAAGLILATDDKMDTLRETLGSLRRGLSSHFHDLFTALGVRSYGVGELARILTLCVLTAACFAFGSSWLYGLDLPAGWISEGGDARYSVTAQATPLMQALHGFINAPLPEEIFSRGPIAVTVFLLAAGPAQRHIPTPWRTVILVVIAAATTAHFASLHSSYGALNVALGGAFGAVAAVLTVKYRSLFPGILVHAMYNAVMSVS